LKYEIKFDLLIACTNTEIWTFLKNPKNIIRTSFPALIKAAARQSSVQCVCGGADVVIAVSDSS